MLQDWKLMRSGVAPFNAVLVGTALQAISPLLLHTDDLQPKVFAFIIFGSFARLENSSLIDRSFDYVALISSRKFSLP
jgi:hypothetical protein